ncbi:glycosyl transferase [Pollutimonas subterranea]|uniref:Glycosyl transferase n=1 Tax=Pollutimonas subterranea TaxID=2045210 RepID=A0A2N4TZG5_9BURK|nr:glycosyltransferase [Pollutimonas subterranea]PLC48157.1 glycosyl transferase [Pollutimonas subterranea]
MLPRIAIVLPAYNEEQTIAATIEAFHAEMPDARIVVVDNNSRDATGRIAADTLERLGANGTVLHEPRQGKGNAVRRAFLDIEADVYVLADADLTYPAQRIHDLVRPILNGDADMVVGDRHSGGHYALENKRALHSFGNTLVQRLVNWLFGARLVDIMSGYRAFNRSFVKTYPILVEGFQIETDMTLHALHRRMRIVELPVEYRDRPVGSVSKLNTFSDGASVIFTIAQILRYYRPMVFFMALSMLFAVAGVVVAVPVFEEWFGSQYISHVPSAVLAAALETVAFLLLAVGVILDSITHHEKLKAELHYLDVHRRSVADESRFTGQPQTGTAGSATPGN